jgi:uncharacterized membrane protein YphA (DoxX/SURF4 family)
MSVAPATLARLTLGFLWVYQGVVPKLVWTNPLEQRIVLESGLFVGSPALTMQAIGVFETILGLWLLSGYRARWAAGVTSAFLLTLSVVVVIIEPALWSGPFGGIIKNLALFTLAWIVIAAPCDKEQP